MTALGAIGANEPIAIKTVAAVSDARGSIEFDRSLTLETRSTAHDAHVGVGAGRLSAHWCTMVVAGAADAEVLALHPLRRPSSLVA